MQKFIHIVATSEVLTVHELVPENKCVKRLQHIKKQWLQLTRHYKNTTDKLVVKTCVNNPEFQFN